MMPSLKRSVDVQRDRFDSSGWSPGLLVSVRNADEAQICLESGVDWIDLKEPLAGSLGCPRSAVASEVAELLDAFPQRSVALGELHDLEIQRAIRLSGWFRFAKVGLSSMRYNSRWPTSLCELSQRLECQLVPVVYADWQNCEAALPLQVIDWAIANRSPYLLVDTFVKNGQRLLDHQPLEVLAGWIEQLEVGGVQIVLAGSLQIADVLRLRDLRCAAVAVRGAVCEGDRRGHLSPRLVRQWVSLIQGSKCVFGGGNTGQE
ncbi:MAG: hypothetical protein KF752_14475 [Pirellulaceae bacterium]|nr:hypothetical protein [Pirellulaceae bacterium]